MEGRCKDNKQFNINFSCHVHKFYECGHSIYDCSVTADNCLSLFEDTTYSSVASSSIRELFVKLFLY